VGFLTAYASAVADKFLNLICHIRFSSVVRSILLHSCDKIPSNVDLDIKMQSKPVLSAVN
jgi:hypothetical protein